MKLSRKVGSTSQVVNVFIQDSSSVLGAGLTGLAYNTSGLVAYYARTKGANTAITLATQTVTGTYSSGGFVEISAANMPGVYRLDIPDAALATAADSVIIVLKGAANMVPLVIEIDLDSQVDLTHWLGTAPATPTVAGVPKVDPTHWNGTAVATPDTAGYPKVTIKQGTGTGELDLTSGRPGIDWAKVGNPTTTVGLSGTTVKTATDVMGRLGAPVGLSMSGDIAGIQGDANDIQDRLPAALTAGGNIKSDPQAIAGSADAATNLAALYSAGVANGTVAAVVGNGDFTLTSTDLTTNDDDYNNMILVFTSGNNKFVPRIVTDYTGATKQVVFSGSGFRGAFPRTVVAGDSWLLLAGSP